MLYDVNPPTVGTLGFEDDRTLVWALIMDHIEVVIVVAKEVVVGVLVLPISNDRRTRTDVYS